jgi:branched-chain amino acid transport system substrate-binding protein
MPPNNYSVYGYDATDVILNSILEIIKENKDEFPTRDKISQKVRETKNFNGLAANITFDENGDNKESKIFIYKYEELIYPADLVTKENASE